MRRLVDGRLGAVLLPVLGLAVLIAVWWLGVLAFHVQPFILPTPWQVAKVFIDSPGDLLGHLRASTVETLEGYALAVVVGLAIALAVVGSRVVDRMFSPLLVGANGAETGIEGSVGPVRDGDGRPAGVMVVFREAGGRSEAWEEFGLHPSQIIAARCACRRVGVARNEKRRHHRH